ncbi:MAG: DUF2461 domain-containing protein [Saprospiraceae bacterium]|nr:DUF2461 domain-containing protein [Saprospiraceae bacterium]
MNGQIIISFLKEIAANNNREWYHANKQKYVDSKAELESLVSELLPELQKFDKTISGILPKDTLFRIFRDVRFSKNKEPYKTNMGAFIAKDGRKSIYSGYYIHIEPGKSFVGGGIYMPQAENLKAIRKEIYYNVDEYKAILADKNFKKYFGEISDMGDSLKKAPKDFPADFPDIELLKAKHFVCGHNLTDEQIASPDILKTVIKAFHVMSPLNNFLNRALNM